MPNLTNKSYFQLVLIHDLVFLSHEFGQVPCAIDISTSEPISLFRSEIYNRVGAQLGSLNENYTDIHSASTLFEGKGSSMIHTRLEMIW